jgi:CubicO group peptidase (beta-lactamase class C family)
VTMVAACSSGGDDKSSEPTESTTATTSPALAAPGAEWETVDPAAVGLDATKLEAIAAVAEEGKSNCLVVVRDGKIAGEWYFRGTNPDSVQEVWSASKSISSTLVGIAQDDGDLKITDSASQYIPSWQGTPAEAVSVRDLLANDSGREWSVAIDYSQMLNAPDQTKFAEELGQPEPPGVTWAYNNSAIQTLDDVVSGATGTEPKDLAAARLFGPLGMTHTNMTTDSSGNTRMFMGVKSTCRDRPIVDTVERGLRVPVVAQSRRCVVERAPGHECRSRVESRDATWPDCRRRARRHVLGDRPRQPDRAGRPGQQDGGGATGYE